MTDQLGKGTALLALAFLMTACSTTPDRARTGSSEADPAEAWAATRAENWSAAAERWNELFLRGGPDQVAACRETARALMELGDHESARGVLNLGLRRDPGHPELLEMKGNVLGALGFRRAAEGLYEEALRASPERPSTLLELARVRIELGQEARALVALDRRIALGHGDAETHLLRGRALLACGQAPEAVEAFERSFSGSEGTPRHLVFAARLCLDKEACPSEPRYTDLAQRWLQRALEIDPQRTEAHRLLGVIHESRGSQVRAIACYRRAVETDPGDLESLIGMARLLDSSGKQGAAEIARRALEFEQDPARRRELERIAQGDAAPEVEQDGR